MSGENLQKANPKLSSMNHHHAKWEFTRFTAKFNSDMLRINHENLLPNQSRFYCFGEHGLCLDEVNFLHKTDTFSCFISIKMPNFFPGLFQDTVPTKK